MRALKNKFIYLTSVSLKRKIKTKWFFIVNIILAIAIIGVINIDSIITFQDREYTQQFISETHLSNFVTRFS